MRKENFNHGWMFKKSGNGWTDDMKEDGIKKITLPHDAMIYEKRNADNPAGAACGYFPGGNYEYTKILKTSVEEKGKTFILLFEGIYNRGWVYVNGTLAGSVQSGYDELKVDITPYLFWGEDNQISVKVINADVPNSRWYTGSGIYRPVTIYTGEAIRVDVDGVHISTPQVGNDISEVLVRTDIICDKNTRENVNVKAEITTETGEIVAVSTTPVVLAARENIPVTQHLYIKNPRLWSIDSPYLYQCKVTVSNGEETIDTSEETFGIRKFELDPVNGLRLNGEKILLRGGCIHHDNGIIGAATIDRAEERRIQLLKEAGFNSVRISHNSSSRAMLRACDKFGMLVMEESFDMWTISKSQYDHSMNFLETWENEVERIVRKDYNHPSVFMYSIGNEIPETATPDGPLLGRKIAEKFRSLDSGRYVTNAINCLLAIMNDLPKVMQDLGFITKEQLKQMMSGEARDSGTENINDLITALMGMMNGLSEHPLVEEKLRESYAVLDLVGMNYMRGAYRLQHEADPNRIFYGSETFSPDIDLNWKEVKQIPACIGDYCWTAWDYIGEAGIGVAEYNGINQFSKPYPVYLAYCGDFDITGFRRPISYYREIVFGLRKKPYIAVQLPEYYGVDAQCTPWNRRDVVSSWTWNGFEGKKCIVEVYSDAKEVELVLNGTSIERKPAGEKYRFKAEFEVEYQRGTLKAISYYEDGTIAEEQLVTASKTEKITVFADRSKIEQDDLSYVTFELTDENGIVNTCDDRKIHVNVFGEGVLQGYGSGDYKSEENFFDELRTPYYGRTVAAIRSGNKSGKIIVTAEAEGIEPVQVEIMVVE